MRVSTRYSTIVHSLTSEDRRDEIGFEELLRKVRIFPGTREGAFSLGARHGVKVRWRRGVAEVEGIGRVDEALLEALEHEGAVLKVVDRGKYEVMLQDDAVVELDLPGGKLGDGRVELGSLPMAMEMRGKE
jgi:hypothetical protein